VSETRQAAVTPAAPPAWGRFFVGCAIAGGLLIVAGLAAFALAMYWLLGSGKQAPTAAIVGPGSIGVVRVADLASDPGARALMGEFMARAQSAPGAGPQLPQWMRNLQASQAQQGVSQWLPREATLSVEPQANDDVGFTAAFNPRGYVRPIRLALMHGFSSDPKNVVSRHGRYEIIGLQKSGALSFMDGTIVLAPDVPRMRATLDRLEAAAKAGPTPAPDPSRTLAGAWDVSGWLDRGLAANVLAAGVAKRGNALAVALDLEKEGAEPPTGLRDLRFGIDVRSKSDADVALDLAFDDAERAAAAEPFWTAALRRRVEQEPGLAATVTPTVDNAHLRYQLALHDLDEMIGRRMDAGRRGFEHP
jgi:hypothetical protein